MNKKVFTGGQVVLPDEGREIRVEARERLGARPLVLHRAEEVDDLTRGGRKGLRGRGFDLAQNMRRLMYPVRF